MKENQWVRVSRPDEKNKAFKNRFGRTVFFDKEEEKWIVEIGGEGRISIEEGGLDSMSEEDRGAQWK